MYRGDVERGLRRSNLGTAPAPSVAPGKPGFAGQTQAVVGIVVIVFDGKGNFTQVDNVKGSVAGFTPDRPGKGTYIVNPDCSTIATVQAAPGVTLVTKSVIVNGGKSYYGFTLTPDDSFISVSRLVNKLGFARPDTMPTRGLAPAGSRHRHLLGA